jgi:hypothetical protein
VFDQLQPVTKQERLIHLFACMLLNRFSKCNSKRSFKEKKHMKTRIILPFVAITALILIVGLACNFSISRPTPTPVPTDTPLPTNTPVPPTKTPVPPTKTPIPTLPIFFTEEFDHDPGANWDLFLMGPGYEHTDKLETSFENSRMRFEITGTDIYAYYFYTAHEYDDVRLDLRVENLGVNSQNISLVCRATDDGWYEFSVGSDGMWYLYAQHDGGRYDLLAMAGARMLKMGHATNDYTMICQGDKISMFVNGEELPYSPFKNTVYFFSHGEVGFNISSIKVFPVITEIDWIKISEP